MSENIFHINPIFFLPIDLEDNVKIKSDEEEDSQNDILNNSPEKHKIKGQIKEDINMEEEVTNEYSSSSSSIKESELSPCHKQIETENSNKQENEEVTIFSKCKNCRYINSLTNSNKIYTSEIFKKNWKLKSRRLITKLKMRLIKQYQNLCQEKVKHNNYKKLNFNNNTHNNPKNNILNSFYRNSLNNYNNCENNYVNSIGINNNLNENSLINIQNIYANININFNQFNNNNSQLIGNTIYNNNELGKFNNYINIQNFSY